MHCQIIKFSDPSIAVSGFATKPYTNQSKKNATKSNSNKHTKNKPKLSPHPHPAWSKQKNQSGMRKDEKCRHGGGSFATPCAPRRGGHGLCLRTYQVVFFGEARRGVAWRGAAAAKVAGKCKWRAGNGVRRGGFRFRICKVRRGKGGEGRRVNLTRVSGF